MLHDDLFAAGGAQLDFLGFRGLLIRGNTGVADQPLFGVRMFHRSGFAVG